MSCDKNKIVSAESKSDTLLLFLFIRSIELSSSFMFSTLPSSPP